MGANVTYLHESTTKFQVQNRGSEFAIGANNKQYSVAQGAEGAPLGKPVDDRKPINFKDSDSGSPLVRSIGELKMRFGDTMEGVASGNLC